ncbi:MAG: nucleoside-diphosphate kinase [Sedimentibacter sp.]|uniref:nucleoside-diphosphate kinase n=1 Tax=Sedimentibacter sp. TaxID=1960295 RepID=UPI002981F4A4|nr:nucleoside-diphosphate kinase [Sedimentibacter sp.]MDW5299838.1 nucleoside-diphosphate kinase [Sedimentibacter sp.]
MIEKTLALIKPDAIERKLMGEIISIYEKNDFHIAALKIIKPTLKIAEEHYFEHKGKQFFGELVNYITRGELCALIIDGKNVIEEVRKINGATDPSNAEEGTIRRRFALSKSENCVHSSDSKESAEREMKIWFPENSILQSIH